jgi:radical SAM protein with 4Fe4S-binding SPASM domain
MAGMNNVILTAQIALTYRCNLNCIHCFESKDPEEELTFLEIKAILQQLKEQGCVKLGLTGGELFLREDILEIIAFAKKACFDIILLTNGTLLTKEIVRQLSKFKPLRIQVSLYGSTKKTHESITGIDDSFERTFDSIQLLKFYNFKFRIATIIMKQNCHETKDLIAIAKKMKCELTLDHVLTPRYSRSKKPLAYRITDNQVKESVAKLKSAGRILAKSDLEVQYEDYSFLPLGGRTACYISAQGEVFPECCLRIVAGSIRKEPFKKIWQDSRVFKNLRKLTREDFSCFSCEHHRYCSWGPGLSWLEHGDFKTAPLEICRLMNKGLRRDGMVIK